MGITKCSPASRCVVDDVYLSVRLFVYYVYVYYVYVTVYVHFSSAMAV